MTSLDERSTASALRGADSHQPHPPTVGSVESVERFLDDAPISRFHRRAVVVSGVGFFTDAYDLFVISTVAVLVQAQWKLSTDLTSWVSGSAILGAFAGALLFGRLADHFGRRRIYLLVAAVMIAGAVAAAASPNVGWLIASRLLLGLGIGGDYPVSAVLMSEYSNRRDRGRLVGLVFSMQAVGLVVGPLVAMALLASGLSHELTWRLLLGFGAIPAASVIYLRSKMPESPRFQARVQGRKTEAAKQLELLSSGVVRMSRPTQGSADTGAPASRRRTLRDFVRDRRMLGLVIGTAGAWFLFDYAYYGNTLSLPAILHAVDGTATLIEKLALSLALFVVFAVPGYFLAIRRMDRIGHRRLQFLGFAVMAVAFIALGAIGPLTSVLGAFIAVFGISYFFIEFGPNTTTFVLPSEVFPTQVRTTGHGTAAGFGKLGAFIGVFLVPLLQNSIGLRGMLFVAGAASVVGFLVTRLIPEPAGRSLEEVSGEDRASPRA
jgi:MFS transporter, PHS family, inorganic phosphate transporter